MPFVGLHETAFKAEAKDATLALRSTDMQKRVLMWRWGSCYSQYCQNAVTWDHPSFETFRHIELKRPSPILKISENSVEGKIQFNLLHGWFDLDAANYGEVQCPGF